jgi:hypothetical protein
VHESLAVRRAGGAALRDGKVRGRSHMSVWTRMNDSASEETSSHILQFAARVLATR